MRRFFFSPDMVLFLFVVLLAWVISALSGCAAPQVEKYDAGKFYARQLEIEVNKQKGIGSLVVPRSTSYEIRVKSKADMDFLLVRSCGREDKFFSEGGDLKYLYQPSPKVEAVRACPLTFVAVEKGNDRRPRGWVEFQDPGFALPASVTCNGLVYISGGVSACQSGAGLFFRIDFSGPTLVESTDPLCPQPKTEDGRGFEWKLPRGDCLLNFIEMAPAHRMHRLSTYGYDEVKGEGG